MENIEALAKALGLDLDINSELMSELMEEMYKISKLALARKAHEEFKKETTASKIKFCQKMKALGAEENTSGDYCNYYYFTLCGEDFNVEIF